MAPGDVLPHPQSNATAHAAPTPSAAPAPATVHVLPPPRVRRQKIPPMPPEIAGAIAEVQKAVRRIGKDGYNNDGGSYRFASVDAFFEYIGPLLGEHGLVIDVDEAEDGFDYYVLNKTYRNGGSSEQHWMRARYVFTLAHRSGVTWEHNPVRTVDVLNTGPQSYGSAQSFATKMYLRTLFKIPTGEREDADYHPTDRDAGYGPGQSGSGQWRNGDADLRRVGGGDRQSEAGRGPDEAPPRITPAEIDGLLRRLKGELEGAADPDAVAALWTANLGRIKQARAADDDAFEAIKETFRLRKMAVMPAEPVTAGPVTAGPVAADPEEPAPAAPAPEAHGPTREPPRGPLPPKPYTIAVPTTADGSFLWDAFAQQVLDVIPRIPDRPWFDTFFSFHRLQLTNLSKVKDMVGLVGGEALTGREAAERVAQARDARLAELEAQVPTQAAE